MPGTLFYVAAKSPEPDGGIYRYEMRESAAPKQVGFNRLENANYFAFSPDRKYFFSTCTIDGIGGVLADAWVTYFKNDKNNEILDHLLADLTFANEARSEEQTLAGKTFVITGSVEHFANRKELQEKIESLGGKAAGSVSAKTSYLINNDVTSNSSKNKKARELGIPILSEADFLKMIGEEDNAD